MNAEIGGETEHRFLGFYRREINDQPYFIYRCICGYIEAVPVSGGPHHPLDSQFRPRADARSLVAHLNLERAHETN
ncbi:MAG TPA: hypothetical protein VJ718_02540 [Candidatus Binataceae bacterium]|nr:hypothetical protein [Candidatus Binataceae bacterium]